MPTRTVGQAVEPAEVDHKEPVPRPDAVRAKRNEVRLAIYLVVPTLALLAIVIGYPVVSAVVMSFFKDAILDPATGLFQAGGFAGFQNYVHWLAGQCTSASGGTAACPPGSLGSQFWNSIFVTFFFTIVTVSLETAFGIWMATIMNRNFRARGLVRAAILIPWAIPTAVTAKLWYFIFAVGGIANSLLHTEILWGSNEWAARFAIIIADTWKTTPFMALLILAGLQLIPEEVYEAARVDGATSWQRFTRITMPLVKPALVVAVLFRVLDALRIYDLPYILTGGGGGNGHATTTLSILVVEQVRQGFNSASALSTITFLVVFLVAFLFVRFFGASLVRTNEAPQKGLAMTTTVARPTAERIATPSARLATPRRTRRARWQSLRTGISALVIVVWCVAPFYWMIVTAFRDVDYTFDTTPWFAHFTWDNFKTALSTDLGNHLGRAMLNSLIIGACVTIIALLVGVFAAYALARLKFRFKGIVLAIILGASMFPGVALITPLFQLFTKIGWMGTYQALIVPSISFVLPLTVYTLTSFLREMPWDLEEAARIDGCTQAQAFRKIILPLAAPAIFTTAILSFILSWNEYLISSQLSSAATQPVTVAIASFAGSQPHQEPYTAVMAAGTIVTIPLVVLVLIFQRRIVAGLTAGGVKG